MIAIALINKGLFLLGFLSLLSSLTTLVTVVLSILSSFRSSIFLTAGITIVLPRSSLAGVSLIVSNLLVIPRSSLACSISSSLVTKGISKVGSITGSSISTLLTNISSTLIWNISANCLICSIEHIALPFSKAIYSLMLTFNFLAISCCE